MYGILKLRFYETSECHKFAKKGLDPVGFRKGVDVICKRRRQTADNTGFLSHNSALGKAEMTAVLK